MDISVNWDKEAHRYQEVFKRCGSNEYNKQLMDFFINELGINSGKRVIDIGCGVGKYGTLFASLGCDVSLTDISSEMLRHARNNMAELPGKHDFLCCDFNEVSLQEPIFKEGYDLAISTMSPAIHDEATLKKMSAISRGWCFVSNFCHWEQPIRDEYHRLMGDTPKHVMNVPRMKERIEELQDCIKSLGYEVHSKVVDYSWTDIRSPQEAAERFSYEDQSEDIRRRSLEIINKLCNEKGEFVDTVNTKVTWTYWKV